MFFVIKFNELFPIVGLLDLLLPFDNFELKTKCDFSKNWELFFGRQKISKFNKYILVLKSRCAKRSVKIDTGYCPSCMVLYLYIT